MFPTSPNVSPTDAARVTKARRSRVFACGIGSIVAVESFFIGGCPLSFRT
jgi:hypothetical protein